MNISEARAVCQRWLDYLDRQAEQALALACVATRLRLGEINYDEAKRQSISAQGHGVTVYDGAELAQAVRVLMDT